MAYFVPHKVKESRPAVAVGIPMTGMLHRTAVNQFLFLLKNMRDDDVFLPCVETAVASEARNTIIRAFLDLPDRVEYLFLFDDDMTIPLHTIEMMTWRKQPFLAGLCTHKRPPYEPVVYLEGATVPADATTSHYGDSIVTNHTIANWEPHTGIREAHGVGAACLCLHRDLLKTVPAPWFKFEQGGEDLYFCRKVRQYGYRVMVDTNVLPGHIGEHVATYVDWMGQRDEVMQRGTVTADELLERIAS